ncbi:GNAT family N-acetyltransferase [Rhodococcus sp. WS4]|nr:GNAT family N-acetyltransferase [Rhodococcus sp. WS4]
MTSAPARQLGLHKRGLQREGHGRPLAYTFWKPARAVEAGVWIGRSHRGAGVGGAVLGHLLDRARADGFDALFVRTKPDNAAVHA